MTKNLWPDDIGADDVLTPQEILQKQAEFLEDRTNSILCGTVSRLDTDDRAVIALEVFSPRLEKRVRLFEAHHRKDFEYPVAISTSIKESADFLRSEVYVQGRGGILSALGGFEGIHGTPGKWVKNEWLASSPKEFEALVERLLAEPRIKSVVLSMIARAQRISEKPTAIENGGAKPNITEKPNTSE